jgi:hypothetical protein
MSDVNPQLDCNRIFSSLPPRFNYTALCVCLIYSICPIVQDAGILVQKPPNTMSLGNRAAFGIQKLSAALPVPWLRICKGQTMFPFLNGSALLINALPTVVRLKWETILGQSLAELPNPFQ